MKTTPQNNNSINLNGNIEHFSSPPLKKPRKLVLEKNRRARINHGLNELKGLLFRQSIQAGRQIEKADILEETIKFIQTANHHKSNDLKEAFMEGYLKCIEEMCSMVQFSQNQITVGTLVNQLQHNAYKRQKALQLSNQNQPIHVLPNTNNKPCHLMTHTQQSAISRLHVDTGIDGYVNNTSVIYSDLSSSETNQSTVSSGNLIDQNCSRNLLVPSSRSFEESGPVWRPW